MTLHQTIIRVPKDELDFLKSESINISDVARKAIHSKCVKLGLAESREEPTANPTKTTHGADSK